MSQSREPLKPNEQYILDRMRWLDSKGLGCFAALDTIRSAATPERWTYSQAQARRLVARLRKKRYLLFAGCTTSGTNIYLFPDREYEAEKLPVCSSRPTHHLWPTDEAERLIKKPLPRGVPFMVEGYPVNRKIAATYSESLIRRAVAAIHLVYGADLKQRGGVKDTAALLRWMCRHLKDSEDRRAAERRSAAANQAQEDRWEKMPEDIRQQLGGMIRSRPAVLAVASAEPRASAAAPAVATAAATPAPAPVEQLGLVSSVFDRWLSGEGKHQPAETRDYYRWKLKRLREHFGGYDLSQLNADLIAGYIAQRRGDQVKEQTIRKELQALIFVAHQAGRNLRADPGLKRLLGRLKTKASRRARPLPTYADYIALRNELPLERRAALDVAVYTGCRRSELFALERNDCDFRNGLLHIRGTKTQGSDRYIPLLPPVQIVARGLKPGERLVPRWSMVHTDLKQACERAGLEPRSLIDLRHTFASWLKNAGIDSMTIAKLMGHTNSKMVEQVYAHLTDATLRQAMEQLPTGPPPTGPPSTESPAPKPLPSASSLSR